MAQIIISTIDSINGSVNVITAFEDNDLIRIYNAYKHSFAVGMLKRKMDAGEILEASDTVENLKEKLSSNIILKRLVDRFIHDLVHGTYNVEQQIILDSNPIKQIEYE